MPARPEEKIWHTITEHPLRGSGSDIQKKRGSWSYVLNWLFVDVVDAGMQSIGLSRKWLTSRGAKELHPAGFVRVGCSLTTPPQEFNSSLDVAPLRRQHQFRQSQLTSDNTLRWGESCRGGKIGVVHNVTERHILSLTGVRPYARKGDA